MFETVMILHKIVNFMGNGHSCQMPLLVFASVKPKHVSLAVACLVRVEAPVCRIGSDSTFLYGAHSLTAS